MKEYPKLSIVGIVCICIPIVILITDAVLLNCQIGPKIFPKVLRYVDIGLNFVVFFIPVGFLLTIIAFILHLRSKKISALRITMNGLGILFLLLLVFSLFLSSLNSARAKGLNATVKSHVMQSQAYAEIYKQANGSYSGLCSSEEIGALLNSAQSFAPKQGKLCAIELREVTCFDSESSYALSAKLHGAEGNKKYFCTDSNRVMQSIENQIAGTECR